MRRTIIALLSCLALSNAQAQAPAPEAPPALAPQPPALPEIPAWNEQFIRPPGAALRLTVHEEPGWFHISVPEGWRLTADRGSGRIALTGPDGRGVSLWMVMIPRTVSAQEAGPLLTGLAAQAAPQTRWAPAAVRAQGPNLTAAAQGSEGNFVRAAGLSVVNIDRVAVVLLALASAPRAAFAESRPLFAAVLESFTPLGGTDGGAASADYVRWRDPSEGAFSLEVPKGWTVRGGVARRSAIDVRSVVQVSNPEQSLLIQAGDTDIPPFIEPAPYLPEGQYNGTALVRRYTPGAAFGREYVLWRIRPLMPNLTIDAARPLPELQRLLQSIYDQYPLPGVRRTIDVGEVLFHGTWNGRPARGYIYAATTRLFMPQGVSMWYTGDLASLGGFLAAEDKVELAAEVMKHMRETFAMNPQWQSAQQRTTAAVSRITTETNRYISDLISKSYARQQRTYDRIFERYSRAQRGVVQVVDPQTQTRYEVQAGSNYYWIDSRGRIVGTDSSFNPNPLWFREMLTVVP